MSKFEHQYYPMEIVKAPFTDEQVTALSLYQRLGIVHPFVCMTDQCDKSDSVDGGVLIPTNDGWVCPCGKYTQDWCTDYSLSAENIKDEWNNSRLGKFSPIK